jgi:hypothetical protein
MEIRMSGGLQPREVQNQSDLLPAEGRPGVACFALIAHILLMWYSESDNLLTLLDTHFLFPSLAYLKIMSLMWHLETNDST